MKNQLLLLVFCMAVASFTEAQSSQCPSASNPCWKVRSAQANWQLQNGLPECSVHCVWAPLPPPKPLTCIEVCPKEHDTVCPPMPKDGNYVLDVSTANECNGLNSNGGANKACGSAVPKLDQKCGPNDVVGPPGLY